jgi:hypothetical protein
LLVFGMNHSGLPWSDKNCAHVDGYIARKISDAETK